MNRKLHFSVSDSPIHWRTHRIMELCDYLAQSVLEPLFATEGMRWQPQFMDFFVLDNDCDPLEPVGVIKFRVPPIFAGRVSALKQRIQEQLEKLHLKLTIENSESEESEWIRIQVLENPTALVAPPDVNMSQMRACQVLRDLLGYQRVNGRYEFRASELLERVASVTEDKIAECTASPVKGTAGLARTPSHVSMRAIHRCLEEVKQFGLWAVRHNYGQLAAG